ncbi:MAG: type II toxin-antitoxin system HicB family antitoxin [Candidatus Chisholmbacteria bacterium]|nr:type II toxin-antitoxin system HicB family antitoxin [Candidatus Chisholmbacteria bacterium]
MKVRKFDYLISLTWDKSYKGYVADVVNLYGCMSQGKTKKEAILNAEKAIKAFIEV